MHSSLSSFGSLDSLEATPPLEAGIISEYVIKRSPTLKSKYNVFGVNFLCEPLCIPLADVTLDEASSFCDKLNEELKENNKEKLDTEVV